MIYEQSHYHWNVLFKIRVGNDWKLGNGDIETMTEKEALKSESKACSERLEAQVRDLKIQLFTQQGKSEMLEDEIEGLRSALAKLSDL